MAEPGSRTNRLTVTSGESVSSAVRSGFAFDIYEFWCCR